MRLLNIYTLEFREFHGDEIPPYLVTSHRWSNDEANYKDVLKKRNKESKGFQKIYGFCKFAIEWAGKGQPIGSKEGWIWIDTCCINQNSSAEVSESINSMWAWYLESKHCLAYLRDVRPLSAGWVGLLHLIEGSCGRTVVAVEVFVVAYALAMVQRLVSCRSRVLLLLPNRKT